MLTLTTVTACNNSNRTDSETETVNANSTEEVAVDSGHESTEQNTQDSEDILVFKHQKFTLTFPAPILIQEGEIEPKNEGDFPYLRFAVLDGNYSPEELLANEAEKYRNYCTETDSCPKIIDSEIIQLDGVGGVRIVAESSGRRLDDPEGFIRTYSYIFSEQGDIYDFVTSSNDLKNPDQVQSQFDQIIESIDFL